MNAREIRFLRRLVAETPTLIRAGVVAYRMATVEGIGQVRGASVTYIPSDYTKARLLMTTRGVDVDTPDKPYTRSEAPRGTSEKLGALPVSHERVAVVPLGLRDHLVVPAGAYVAMPWRMAMELPYAVLLVVENLESLQQLHTYTWLSDFIKGRQALALYRGGPQLFRTDAAAALLAADNRPTLAFFDFDPKGLSMAASLPRREALCLPAWRALEASVRDKHRQDLFTNSANQCRAQLDRVEDAQIAAAWRQMKRLTLGLDQEGFPR